MAVSTFIIIGIVVKAIGFLLFFIFRPKIRRYRWAKQAKENQEKIEKLFTKTNTYLKFYEDFAKRADPFFQNLSSTYKTLAEDCAEEINRIAKEQKALREKLK